MNELELAPKQAVALARPAPTVADMLAAVIDKGVTGENAAALEKLVALYERMEDRRAEQQFAEAFVRLQKEIPKVQATKTVPNKDGSLRYAFAPFEEVDNQARPICLQHGFSYSFSEGPAQPGKLTKICILQHVGGHKREVPYSVRIGSGPPGCSDSQADGAAHSYAKRGALCDALTIVVRHQDNDARNEGGAITPEQAKAFRDRINLLAPQVNSAAFLKVAGVSEFEKIPAVMFPVLDAMLKKKESKAVK